MRRHDELLGRYHIADGSTRRYILDEVERLPIHYDSDELESLLDLASLGTDPTVAAEALAVWDSMGPTLTLYAHALAEDRPGIWTTLVEKARAGTDGPGPESASPDGHAQRQALTDLLAPCHESLLRLATTPGATGDRARQVLALLPVPGREDALTRAPGDPRSSLTALMALVRIVPDPSRVIQDPTGAPLWVRTMVAGVVGGRAGLVLAREAMARGSELDRWGAARALAHLGDQDWPRLTRALMARERGWIQVLLMDTLGDLAGRLPSGATDSRTTLRNLVESGIRDAEHDMIRICGLRALARVGGERSLELALRGLGRGTPLVQAAAIEALARLGCRDPSFPKALGARAARGPLKLRGTAILGLLTHDPEQALRHAVDLVRSGDPASRVEGVYCLGYVQCRTSLAILGQVAARDPFLPSAIQAVKSLAHYPASEACQTLLHLLDRAPPPVALSALCALSHFPVETAWDLIGRLDALGARLDHGGIRVLLRNSGRLGPMVRDLATWLGRHRPDREATIGALEGLSRLGSVPDGVLERAFRAVDTAVRVHGARTALLAGDASGVDPLAAGLKEGQGALDAVTALRDLAILAGRAGFRGQHEPFQRLLVAPGTPPTRERADPEPGIASRAVPETLLVPRRADDGKEALIRHLGVDRKGLLAEIESSMAVERTQSLEEARRTWPLVLSNIQSEGLALLTGMRALAHPAFMIAVVMVCVMVIGVSAYQRVRAGSMPLEDPGSLDRTLRVQGMVGDAFMSRDGREHPLTAGEALPAGSGLVTSADSQVRVGSISGSTVLVFPGTEIRVTSTEPLSLEILRGACVIDSAADSADRSLEVRGGFGSIASSRVVCRIDRSIEVLTIQVGVGRATVTARDGGGETEVPAGHVISIARSGEVSAPVPYDPASVAWR